MRLIALLGFASSFFAVQADTTKPVNSDTIETHVVEINQLLQVADQQIGTPYSYGGCAPSGFDCSGFIKYCFETALDMELPHRSEEIAALGSAVSRTDARPGDIITFTGRSINGVVGHVGIVYEVTVDAVYFIHSSSSNGIRVDKVKSHYWQKRFLGIRRILD